MKRFEQLDSIRGVACLMVLLYHFLLLFPQFVEPIMNVDGYWLIKLIRYTPLRVIWAGYEAVMLFFVLSGFVLALPFLTSRHTPYIPFAIKRIFRIYIPYIVAILIAITLSWTARSDIKELSNWFNEFNWNTPFSWSLLGDHLVLVGEFDTHAFVPVVWSLVHEMRISLIFPFIMLAVIRFNWKWTVLISFLLSSIILVHWSWYSITLHYMFMFVIGALLAKHREFLIEQLKKTSRRTRLIFFVAAVLLLGLKIPGGMLPFGNPSLIKFVSEWGNSMGAAMLVILALSGGWFSKFLLLKPIHFIGKLSYSIYLYHLIALVTLINLLYGLLPFWLMLVIAFLATIGVSALSYYWIELPSVAWGKYMAKKAQVFLNPRTASSPSKDI
ncbi:acyltransferase [Paenibacillus filicis]|uniref:Acyltransferase n=1 Tax=Paenibacillus filicis TaxID=669464 RepID=A0ABU9DF16_9BACL